MASDFRTSQVIQRSAVFVDTSIQISRFFKTEELKEKIRTRLGSFDLVITGIVVRHEFRRRVLTEAKYLLNQLDRYNSAQKVQQHVVDQLGPFHGRKRTICLELLSTFYPQTNDQEHTEILKGLLRSLLVCGLEEFDDTVDSVISDSGCACGRQEVREIKPYQKYDLGKSSCEELASQCEVAQFILQKRPALEAIQDVLRKLEPKDKSEELTAIENMIGLLLEGAPNINKLKLCSHVGDLLIALESAHIPNFYTQNVRESEHLCKALRQGLFYRSNNPTDPDEIREFSSTNPSAEK